MAISLSMRPVKASLEMPITQLAQSETLVSSLLSLQHGFINQVFTPHHRILSKGTQAPYIQMEEKLGIKNISKVFCMY